MNNEIKEILDKLKDREETYQFCKQYKLSINDWIYEAHYLLDYITNLQQENENLKDFNAKLQATKDRLDKYDYENTMQIKDLQQENERLKENNSDMQEEMARTWQKCDDLQQENERLKEENQQEIKEANDSITWWTNRFKAVERDNRKLKQENERLKHQLNQEKPNYLQIWQLEDRIDKAIEYNYELQERYCHSAIFDELVASKVYEITEKELNILQNGSDASE